VEYRNLGNSGLKVSVVGLGCNNFGMRIDTEQTRVVLHLDFARPLRRPLRLLNALVLHSFAFRPFIREGLFRARWWERRFYREAQALRQAAAARAAMAVAPAANTEPGEGVSD